MSSIETTSDGKRAHLIGTPSGTGDRDSYGAPIRQRNDKSLYKREIKNDWFFENSHDDRTDDPCEHFGGAGRRCR
jgi:hypothetical protein